MERSLISVVVKVTVVDTSRVMLSIISELGSWFTRITSSVFLVITSEHWVSVALDDAVELANLLVVFSPFQGPQHF